MNLIKSFVILYKIDALIKSLATEVEKKHNLITENQRIEFLNLEVTVLKKESENLKQ